MISIQNENDIKSYFNFFKSLNDNEISVEIEIWEDKIKRGLYNEHEFLTFTLIMDLLDMRVIGEETETIKVLDKSIDELYVLTDFILDKYKGDDKEKYLLDNINRSINECEVLRKYYNKKITNDKK